MLKIKVLFFAVALSLATASAQATPYTDKANNYALELPADWQTKTDPIVTMVAVPGDLIKEVNAFPNIKVVARAMPVGYTLDSLCDASVKQWGPIWKVLSDKHVTTGKTVTRRLELEQTIPIANQKTRVLKAFAVGSDKYYIVSCSDKPENFEKSKASFEAVIDSHKLSQ